MLDLQLSEASGEVRIAAVTALGQLGGPDAAVILVNALRYYDMLLRRQEQMTYRGIFSGEEQTLPYGPGYGGRHGTQGRAGPDSLVDGAMPGQPRVGVFGGELGRGPVNMFGEPEQQALPQTQRVLYEEEQKAAHGALVRVGPDALAAVDGFLHRSDASRSLQLELLAIGAQIRGLPLPEGAGSDSTARHGVEAPGPGPSPAAGPADSAGQPVRGAP
jgi:hypothetical protein